MSKLDYIGILKAVVLFLLLAAAAIGICFAISYFGGYPKASVLEIGGAILLIIGGLCAFGGTSMKMDINDNVTRLRRVGKRAYEEEMKLNKSSRLFFVGIAIIGVILFLVPIFL